MADLFWNSLVTPVVTAAVAVISIFLTSWLAQQRTNKEKLWDLRRQAYGVILSELTTVEHICKAADTYIEEDALQYFHGETFDRHNAQIQEHMVIVRKRFSDDFLILSDAFIKRFEAFLEELRAGFPDESPPEKHERFRDAVVKSRPVLLDLARREMTPQKPRFWKPWF